MIKFEFDNLIIEIYDDPTFSFNSTDHSHVYSRHYSSGQALEFPVSKHGIRILNDGVEINSCIVIGSGGATGVHGIPCFSMEISY
jgi:hypothetical protein